MKKTKFLTIFPSFENLSVVKQTLPSIIEETKENDARLIVHDSSVNNREEKWNYLKELNENDDFFLILSSNMSMAHARNMCLQLGQELYAPEYICMVEDDHGFNKGLISKITHIMKKYYGEKSPNGEFQYGLFSACTKHLHTTEFLKINEDLLCPAKKAIPMAIGGVNSCFRCAPTSHWNNVLKGYDTDEYLISTYQTKHLNFRNYNKGFTTLTIDSDREYAFSIENEGRGSTDTSSKNIWDDNYTASDERSDFLGKEKTKDESILRRVVNKVTGSNKK